MPVIRTRGAGSTPPPAITYRATTLPSGRLMPIEARIGHRLLRIISPDSPEGRRLLDEGRVEIVTLVTSRRDTERDH